MSRQVYSLEKYRGKASRHTCPGCGRPHCFTLYVDNEGNLLNPDVGRCDHESSCGYHYTPKQYFKDNDWHVSNSPFKFQNAKKECSILKSRADKDINYIPYEYVNRSVRPDTDSSFTAFLKKFIPKDKVVELVNEYKIGVTNAGDVIFFEIDMTGKCRTGKIMKYNSETGHRIKDEVTPYKISWVHTRLIFDKILPKNWTVTQCLFGEHLLSKYPTKGVALVEAEKTAVICAVFLPQYIWMATGGKSQLNDRINVLKGRKVIAFPDRDAISDWRKAAVKYPDIQITVSSLIESAKVENNSTADLADWIISWSLNQNIT